MNPLNGEELLFARQTSRRLFHDDQKQKTAKMKSKREAKQDTPKNGKLKSQEHGVVNLFTHVEDYPSNLSAYPPKHETAQAAANM